jgi:FkbM family methyltransferase
MSDDTKAAINPMGRNASFWRRMAYQAFDGRFFVRRAATPDGQFDVFVSAGCQLDVLDPRGVRIDPVHSRFIDRWVTPESVVYDVGGNMGLFSFAAALKAKRGHVYSFEPDIDLARALLRSLQRPRNKELPVSIIGLALSDADGTAEFQIAKYGRSMNKFDGVGRWHDELFEASQRRTVPTLRMDVAAKSLKPPTVIKIDVEGAEMMVLNGGRETIARQRPVMLVEGPRELWPELTALFKELDYVMFDGVYDAETPLAEPVWDTVAVPREKVRPKP